MLLLLILLLLLLLRGASTFVVTPDALLVTLESIACFIWATGFTFSLLFNWLVKQVRVFQVSLWWVATGGGTGDTGFTIDCWEAPAFHGQGDLSELLLYLNQGDDEIEEVTEGTNISGSRSENRLLDVSSDWIALGGRLNVKLLPLTVGWIAYNGTALGV